MTPKTFRAPFVNHGVDIRDAAPDAVIDSLEELRGLVAAQA